MKFNEDSRVKIPSIIHLTRLGYEYISLKDAVWDEKTNIFTDIFKESIRNINPDIEEDEIERELEDLSLTLDNEDLGKVFYEHLVDQSGIKIIDFSDFNKNFFHVVTELPYKNGDDVFRPDIILLINGIPLVFIEVKKPNNKEGIIAEHNRIKRRFQNPKFKRFINVTQIMVFSNNMEYDSTQTQPIEGAFYATPSYGEPIFNYFREEEDLDTSILLNAEDDETENFILRDNNLNVIKHNPEFITNKDPNTPTNRLSTSLFSRDRLEFFLSYAIAYVRLPDGIEKHIMRYPQFFATKAIVRKLDEGVKKGIIWHTQGSGKTALAFYNVKFLSDYFQQKNIIPKFYFIVDRLDLLIQAQREFSSRGLIVNTINSRDEFAKEIKSSKAIHNLSGKLEITVVNIQKFKDDPSVTKSEDYDVNIQRVYFLDEVHRSYDPKGSFLANLSQSDRNAIKIGLTGTPLLGETKSSRALFGNYIHKYYYNASISDGYTLRLIREEIETKYKILLKQALTDIEILQGDIPKKLVYSHKNFVEPMLDYIVEDFEKSRLVMNDNSIGGMVICDSSEQAKEAFEIFQEKYGKQIKPEVHNNHDGNKNVDREVTSAALILHDVGSKDYRKNKIEDFKQGKIDLLFVYNMLLTGFDSSRLKKLYMGRVIKKHNLLQALTRVNRPYNQFRHGFVVDFADIRKEFDATNKAYFDELQLELGDEFEHYSNLFLSPDEILTEIEKIKNILFSYDTLNAEIFSQQITEIQDREEVREIQKALSNIKSLYNMIRLLGHYDLLDELDFDKFNILYREVSNHLDLLNLKENLENNAEVINILNIAMEDILFKFVKVSEEELVIADDLKNILRKAREEMANNFDPKDPFFISLREELERLFKEKNLDEITQEEMKANISSLTKIHEKIKELNRQNELLKAKYQYDPKYARIHKRLMETNKFTKQELKLYEALLAIKEKADEEVLRNTKMLENESYFNGMMMQTLVKEFKEQQKIELDPETSEFINKLVVTEYMNEFMGVAAW